MPDPTQAALDLLGDMPAAAPALIFAAAFAESLAIVSLFVPGTVILFAAGALASGGHLRVAPILAAAALGAVLGDGVSYWLGRHYGEAIERALPRYRPLIERGVAFFARYGDAGIVIGRFFGPVRAVVPLAAGILRMPRWRFWLANIGSAALWAPLVLFSGTAFGRAAHRLFGAETGIVLAIAIAVAALAAVALRVRRSRRAEAPVTPAPPSGDRDAAASSRERTGGRSAPTRRRAAGARIRAGRTRQSRGSS